jgi:hypothetical protein
MRALILALITTALFSAAAFAQQSAPPGGPLVLQPVGNGFMFGPDVKITDLHDKVGTLVGGYAGALIDSQLFLGGAGYGLVYAQGSTHQHMGYGGFVIGWAFDPRRPVTVSTKALLGFGEAWQGDQSYYCTGRGCGGYYPYAYGYGVRAAFFVAEPEIDLVARIGRNLQLTGGIGYRATNEPYGYNLHTGGVTGSFSVGFAVGK